MEITLLSSANLRFGNAYKSNSIRNLTCRKATVTVTNLEPNLDTQQFPGSFLHKLENLLVSTPLGYKRARLYDDSSVGRLTVQLSGGERSSHGYLSIKNDVPSSILERLAKICGDPKNVDIDIALEFGFNDDLKMNQKWKLPFAGPLGLTAHFNFSAVMLQKWLAPNSRFKGSLTMKMTLNNKALNRIYLGRDLLEGQSASRKILEEAIVSGDVVLEAGDGAKLRFHKLFLAAYSDMLKTHFENYPRNEETGIYTLLLGKMTGAGLKALMDYVYCHDIEKPLEDCEIALQLLFFGNKCRFRKLEEIMRDVILLKKLNWFTEDVASRLQRFTSRKGFWDFAGEEGEQEILQDFEKLGEKAKAVLELLSPDTYSNQDNSEVEEIHDNEAQGSDSTSSASGMPKLKKVVDVNNKKIKCTKVEGVAGVGERAKRKRKPRKCNCPDCKTD